MNTLPSPKPLLYADITEKILEAAFEVSKELGSGFLESVYKNAMVIALRAKGMKVEVEKPISVMFRGQSVGQFYADLFVEGKVIIGLLINFGRPKIEYKRLHK